MKQVIEVGRGADAPSRVVIGDAINSLENYLPSDRKVVIVTDPNVHRLYKEIINRYDYCLIGLGEPNKTLGTAGKLYGELLARGADRSTFLVGFGGGIVTDVTGFVASTYMRGVRFGFLPTTLLAQVDASIGGKNGVNLDGYKNIIGVFNQPEFVLCDPELLSSLPDREFRAGLAEVIKAGIIGDAELFSMVERHSFEEIRSDAPLLRELIIRSIRVKTAIVEHDQRERGERRKLNLGHTFAHAIEKSFTNLSHGEAVAAGMAIVCDAAVRAGKLDEATADRIRNVISSMGLPTEYPVEMKQLLIAIRADKKREGNGIYLVFPRAIGECSVEMVNTDSLEDIFLDAAKAPQKPAPQSAVPEEAPEVPGSLSASEAL